MFGVRARKLSAYVAVTTMVAAVATGADTDQDGVDDDADVCCRTPLGMIVDDSGRPLGDLDGDCAVGLDDVAMLPGLVLRLSQFASLQNNFTEIPGEDGPCCAAALDPVDDGTGLPVGGVPDIIISEIDPGTHIEVFNTTDAEIDLSLASNFWCSRPQYVAVATSQSVAATGYATLPWPGITNAADSGGEIILFRDDLSFRDATRILDFVCWGTGLAGGRKAQAEGVGKWSGPCAPPIPSDGAIHRKTDNDGTTAGSYDVTSPPSPMDCTP